LKHAVRLNSIDKKLLQLAQDEFPLTNRPWADIGNRLGITEGEVMKRLSSLCRRGIVRKVGPALDARRVGLRASTLIAMKVPDGRIRNVAKLIGEYEGVSHCYQRENEYTLWSTMVARDEIELKKMLEEVRHRADIVEDDMLDLRPTKIFKIDVRFQLV
jgi:DNA-binding Lrp family transcriptional regulator